MAIFKKKMPSVGPKSPEDQRDKPKAQVNNKKIAHRKKKLDFVNSYLTLLRIF